MFTKALKDVKLSFNVVDDCFEDCLGCCHVRFSQNISEIIEELGLEEADFMGISNADHFIQILDYMIKRGINPEFEYSGKAFWLYHDLYHATHDVWGGEIYVDDGVEEKALNEASIEYLKDGWPVDEAFNELMEARKDFPKRFRREVDLTPVCAHLKSMGYEYEVMFLTYG